MDEHAPTPPLAGTFAQLAPLGGGPHLPPHPPGPWRPAAELAADPEAVGALLDQVGEEWRCTRADVQGMRVVEMWAWTVAAAGAGAILTDGRLPDLRADNVLMAHGADAPWPPIALGAPRFAALPDDPAVRAGHPDVERVLPDRDALARELHRQLTSAHLAPLVVTVAGLAKRSRRSLWRGAGDRVAQAFALSGETLGDAAAGERLAAQALEPGAPLPNSGRIDVRAFPRGDGSEERVLLRDGCCLYYRVPGDGETCLGCPLVDDAERATRIAAGC